jgi:hypothetical protein
LKKRTVFRCNNLFCVAAFQQPACRCYSVVSDEGLTDDIAKVLVEAIGKPDLKWVVFRDEDALNGMLQAGLTQDVAENLVEVGRAAASGEPVADYMKHKPKFVPLNWKILRNNLPQHM